YLAAGTMKVRRQPSPGPGARGGGHPSGRIANATCKSQANDGDGLRAYFFASAQIPADRCCGAKNRRIRGFPNAHAAGYALPRIACGNPAAGNAKMIAVDEGGVDIA